MSEWAAQSRWGTRGQYSPYSPLNVWRYNGVNAASQNLTGISTLGGLAVTTTTTVTPTQWANVQGTGIVINKTGGGVEGRIYTTWAGISTLLTRVYGRALRTTDTVVMALQVDTSAPTVIGSLVQCVYLPAADNNDSIARVGKLAASANAAVFFYDGTVIESGQYAFDNGTQAPGTIAGARTITKWLWGGGGGSTTFISTAVLSDMPIRDTTAYGLRSGGTSSTAPRALASTGTWAPGFDATGRIQWELRMAALETDAQAIQELAIWVIPGSPP